MDLAGIAEKYGLKLLVVFGSHGTVRQTKSSDIDLGFCTASVLSPEQLLELMMDLSVNFQKSEVDLVDLDRAVPLLAYEIACKGRVLHESENAFLLFKLKASARYADTRHLREQRKQFLDSRIAEALGKNQNTFFDMHTG